MFIIRNAKLIAVLGFIGMLAYFGAHVWMTAAALVGGM
jgi:hypothetical protein